jgi:hypothetical protein
MFRLGVQKYRHDFQLALGAVGLQVGLVAPAVVRAQARAELHQKGSENENGGRTELHYFRRRRWLSKTNGLKV